MNTKVKQGASAPMIENPVPWPNKARVAATFTWDLDADSILHNAHPDDSYSRVAAMSHLRYGPDIAGSARVQPVRALRHSGDLLRARLVLRRASPCGRADA